MPWATPILHPPDQGPESQQRWPEDATGFQSNPVQLTLLMQTDWHLDNVIAASDLPSSTFVFSMATQLSEHFAAYTVHHRLRLTVVITKNSENG